MSIQKLWYIKRRGEVNGPFPAGVITQYVLLGRYTANDLVSLDKLAWLPVSEFEELSPKSPPAEPIAVSYKSIGANSDVKKWRQERIKATRRWLDERSGERRAGESDPERYELDPGRRKRDRRKTQESAEILALRQHNAARERLLKKEQEKFRGVAVLLVGLVATLTGLAFYAPVYPVKVNFGWISPVCKENANPQVNWRGCDKQGSWLRGVNLSSANLKNAHFNSAELGNSNLSFANLAGADLSYANLNHANLLGANLTQADLSYVELRGADLRKADLRGATLEAATLVEVQLAGAIWTDGTVCATGSIGRCLHSR